jgi:hypothetical protein
LKNHSNQEIFVEKTKTTSFNISLEKGNNVFFLVLQEHNNSVDAQRVIVFADETLEVVEELVITENKEADETINKEVNVTTTPSVAIEEKEEILYESKSEKVKKYLNYGLVILIVSGLSIFIKGKLNGRKRNKTQNRIRRLGSKQSTLRDGWQASRTHKKNTPTIHSDTEEKQRNNSFDRRNCRA